MFRLKSKRDYNITRTLRDYFDHELFSTHLQCLPKAALYYYNVVNSKLDIQILSYDFL